MSKHDPKWQQEPPHMSLLDVIRRLQRLDSSGAILQIESYPKSAMCPVSFQIRTAAHPETLMHRVDLKSAEASDVPTTDVVNQLAEALFDRMERRVAEPHGKGD